MQCRQVVVLDFQYRRAVGAKDGAERIGQVKDDGFRGFLDHVVDDRDLYIVCRRVAGQPGDRAAKPGIVLVDRGAAVRQVELDRRFDIQLTRTLHLNAGNRRRRPFPERKSRLGKLDYRGLLETVYLGTDLCVLATPVNSLVEFDEVGGAALRADDTETAFRRNRPVKTVGRTQNLGAAVRVHHRRPQKVLAKRQVVDLGVLVIPEPGAASNVPAQAIEPVQ